MTLGEVKGIYFHLLILRSLFGNTSPHRSEQKICIMGGEAGRELRQGESPLSGTGRSWETLGGAGRLWDGCRASRKVLHHITPWLSPQCCPQQDCGASPENK